MIQEFNQWWNKDDLTNDNLYRKDTPMYWAWEGWQAGVKAEREACAKTVEEWLHGEWHNQGVVASLMIRERGQE